MDEPGEGIGLNGPTEIAFHNRSPLGLRVTDQETARVTALHRENGQIVGSCCLLDDSHILTCRHVVEAAVSPQTAVKNRKVLVTLVGVDGQPTVNAKIRDLGGKDPENDLALLKLDPPPRLSIPPVEFASPLRHGGKSYSVLGFPSGDRQGRNATGRLNAVDARGLVQMDRGGALFVLGGFSGAPVWSVELGAFVGIVVTELNDVGVAWCIPSRLLCEFYNNLVVRFRIAPADRPAIHDYDKDDPNVQLFGRVSNNGQRRLSAVIRHRKRGSLFPATAKYERLPGSPPLRGGYVTFIMFPDFESKREDKYELFAPVVENKASVEFGLDGAFTIAAIGDGGDTALTFNMGNVRNKPRGF